MSIILCSISLVPYPFPAPAPAPTPTPTTTPSPSLSLFPSRLERTLLHLTDGGGTPENDR